jgi:pimeloyl-ACP methyl ester carboxylesterase
MWRPQMDELSAMARCISFDWRGFGASDEPGEYYSIEDMASDTLRVLDTTGIERAVIVGLSMGGYVALALAELAPERLLGLVLADTRTGADTAQVRQARMDLRDLVAQGGVERILPAQVSRLLSAQAPSELGEWVRDMILEASPRGVRAAALAMAERPDRTGVLQRLSCPILGVCGNEDTVTPPSELHAAVEPISGSSFKVIEGAGHLSNLEATAAFNAALRAFLKTL